MGSTYMQYKKVLIRSDGQYLHAV